MRIAILAPVAWRTPPRHYGPWEQISSNIAEGLVAAGLDVTLFATADSLTSGKLKSVVTRGYEEDRTRDAKVLECLHISHLMEQSSDFDIIHNNFDFLPLTYSGLIGTPMLTTIHGFSSEQIIRVYQRYNRKCHYVSISNANRVPELDYVKTVYNGLRTDDFTFSASSGDYLVFLGRIHHEKGTAEAVEIAKKSKKRLIIAGIIQDQRYFDEKIVPELNDQISYIGEAGPEKRDELLGNADALLHPINFDEPFGLSVAEAMMCGTPVIAFNRGSMPELVLHERTGFLVNSVPEAVEAIADLQKIDRKNCRQWSLDQFSQEKMIQDYLEVYQTIL